MNICVQAGNVHNTKWTATLVQIADTSTHLWSENWGHSAIQFWQILPVIAK